jgi:hypothetical protein
MDDAATSSVYIEASLALVRLALLVLVRHAGDVACAEYAGYAECVVCVA